MPITSNFHQTLPALFNGEIPPRIHRLIKTMLKTMQTYEMLPPTEKMMLGISGGKDSLSLALLISLAKKFYSLPNECIAVQVDWNEYPMSPSYLTEIKAFFKLLDIEYRVCSESIEYFTTQHEFNCYGCSRARRKRLFELCDEQAIHYLAFGHHLDDAIETNLINLINRGRIDSLKPSTPFWEGKINIIRPLIEISEIKLAHLSEELGFPILEINCPKKQINLRNRYQPLLTDLYKIDPEFKSHLYKAFYNREL